MMRIEFTPAEQKLYEQIELKALDLKDHVHAKRNGELTEQLMRLLIQRKVAIPQHRVHYFTHQDYFVEGRGKSRKEMFERNGTSGAEIFHHPHFLEYLRYFVEGPQLPGKLIEAFQAKVDECGSITSGDIVPLAKLARQLTREHALTPRDASEEFFKLALEHGLSPDWAVTIRNQVRSVR